MGIWIAASLFIVVDIILFFLNLFRKNGIQPQLENGLNNKQRKCTGKAQPEVT